MMAAMQRFRLFSILLLIPSMLLPVYLNGPRYLYLYATQWSIELATFALLIGYLHERYPKWNLEKVASASLGAAIYLALGTMVGFWVAFARVYFPLISKLFNINSLRFTYSGSISSHTRIYRSFFL